MAFILPGRYGPSDYILPTVIMITPPSSCRGWMSPYLTRLGDTGMHNDSDVKAVQDRFMVLISAGACRQCYLTQVKASRQ